MDARCLLMMAGLGWSAKETRLLISLWGEARSPPGVCKNRVIWDVGAMQNIIKNLMQTYKKVGAWSAANRLFYQWSCTE